MNSHCLLVLLLTACHGAPDPCSPAEFAAANRALESLYGAAANDVINSGACDGYQRVEECPAYATIEKSFQLSQEAICHR